jgi:hypothetical protein
MAGQFGDRFNSDPRSLKTGLGKGLNKCLLEKRR